VVKFLYVFNFLFLEIFRIPVSFYFKNTFLRKTCADQTRSWTFILSTLRLCWSQLAFRYHEHSTSCCCGPRTLNRVSVLKVNVIYAWSYSCSVALELFNPLSAKPSAHVRVACGIPCIDPSVYVATTAQKGVCEFRPRQFRSVSANFGLFRRNPRQPLAELRLKNTAPESANVGKHFLGCSAFQIRLRLQYTWALMPQTRKMARSCFVVARIPGRLF